VPRVARRNCRLLANRHAGATFLCYHSISARGPRVASIPPELFEAQLALLRDKGYVSGGLPELRTLATGQRLPGRHVFLTFDDGFRDNATEALPLLRAYGFTAWFFIIPPLVDEGAALAWPEASGKQRAHTEVMRSLTWDMVEEMAAAGMEFGSHTLTHPHLPELDDDALTQELLDSRRRVVERLGQCDALAYPFGHWTPRVADAAAAAGYSFAFSLPFRAQLRATRMSIPRIMVDRRDTPPRFALKLSGPGRRFLLSRGRPVLRSLWRRLGGSSLGTRRSHAG
jgi:peptidoglycan/xylan/chitin deacetylase (PgdA/CDA1 family)